MDDWDVAGEFKKYSTRQVYSFKVGICPLQQLMAWPST